MTQMVDFQLKDGNLHIILLPEAREEVEELRGRPTDAAFGEIIEDWLGNGWSWVRPEDIGALTEAPILSEDVDYDDHGDVKRVGRIYYFADYQLRSEVDDLMTKGEVVFTGMD